jgi:hypothetical protein
MSNFENTAARINAAKAIGRGERLTGEVTEVIVASLPETFDAAARGAVSSAVVAWLDPEGNEKQKVGAKGAQKTTDFGRGVDTLTRSVKRALTVKGDKPAVLRVSLSGEGGGSTTVAADHPLYAALVAMIAGDAADGETVTDASGLAA